MAFLKECFKKVNFEKKNQQTTIACKDHKNVLLWCAVTCIIMRWFKILDVRVDAICKLETLLFVMPVNISNKPPLVGEYTFH